MKVRVFNLTIGTSTSECCRTYKLPYFHEPDTHSNPEGSDCPRPPVHMWAVVFRIQSKGKTGFEFAMYLLESALVCRLLGPRHKASLFHRL